MCLTSVQPQRPIIPSQHGHQLTLRMPWQLEIQMVLQPHKGGSFVSTLERAGDQPAAAQPRAIED